MKKCTVVLLRAQHRQGRCLSGTGVVLASWSWLEPSRSGWSQLELIFPLLFSNGCCCTVEATLVLGSDSSGQWKWPDRPGLGETAAIFVTGCGAPSASPMGPLEETTTAWGRRNGTSKSWAGSWDEWAATTISVITFCFTLNQLAQWDIRRKSTMPKKDNKEHVLLVWALFN